MPQTTRTQVGGKVNPVQDKEAAVEKVYHIGPDVHRRFSQVALRDDTGILLAWQPHPSGCARPEPAEKNRVPAGIFPGRR